MGIFDFFKKKKPVEIQKEKISFDKIEDWIRVKTFENQNEEKDVFVLIKDKIDEFVNECQGKIKNLEEVDISDKKEQEKIKSVVNDSRDSYIESVETLLEKLESLERKSLERFTKEVNKVFFNFNKSSHKNYERATILIGKEMEKLRECLRSLSKELVKILDENKKLIEEKKSINNIESKLMKINNDNKEIDEIQESIENIEKQISEKKKQNKRLLYEVEQIKDSSEYLENIKRKEKIKFLEKDLNDKIFSLKQFIDFKVLAEFFHINPEQMQIVKQYREDFVSSFKKDNGKQILNLIEEVKQDKTKILEGINEIDKIKQDIINLKQKITKDPTIELSVNSNKLISEIQDLEKQNTIKQNKKQELDLEISKTKDLIKKELEKLNVEIIEDLASESSNNSS